MKIINKLNDNILIILKSIFNLFHIHLGEESILTLSQFIKFGIVGLTNTGISYFSYLIFLWLIPDMTFDYIIAQFFSFTIGVCWSFYWNNRFVFIIAEGEKRNIFYSFLKTYISYSFTGLFLSSILLVFWINIFHIRSTIAPLFNLVISVPINFVINKFWAFKNN